ncbi:MAG: energy-coupling factor transporter ATPase, partial [Oscillospiraceae bacterium]
GRETVFGLIKEYHRATGSTIILVSHSMEDVAKIANRVMVINNSKIFKVGSVDEVFSDSPRLMEMGLSVPSITRVFMELKEKGLPMRENVYTVEDAREEVLRLLGRVGK